MDKFEEKKQEVTKKRTFTKNTWYDWYDWLTIRTNKKKTTCRVKDQIMSLFRRKDYGKPELLKTVHEGGKK